MYWPHPPTYRTIGPDPLSSPPSPSNPVLSYRGPPGSFDNGGSWLYSVFRKQGNNLIGFYHGEDHEWPPHVGVVPDPINGIPIAWVSIARCTSDDNGESWTRHGQIITSATPKPVDPTWGGAGNFSVVYDNANSRWMCFFIEDDTSVTAAISEDPDGKPGTWLKYKSGSFTEPGLGGDAESLEGLRFYWGGNPSVHFNSYLNEWGHGVSFLGYGLF